MAQSQYATTAQIQLLAITPAAFARFEAAAPGCVTAALQAASSVADSSLSSQFILPLVVSPQGWDMALTRVVCFLAAYDLYFNFGFNPSAPDWQVFTSRKEWADKWLDGVGKKTITPLYVDQAGSGSGSDSAGDFVISDPPVGFTDRGVTNAVPVGSSDWWW
jgi:phage gp36-like protein